MEIVKSVNSSALLVLERTQIVSLVWGIDKEHQIVTVRMVPMMMEQALSAWGVRFNAQLVRKQAINA